MCCISRCRTEKDTSCTHGKNTHKRNKVETHVVQPQERRPLCTNFRPSKVRESIRDAFADAGWDVRSNSATRDDPPSLGELHTFLDSTLDLLETFEPQVGEKPIENGNVE